MIRNTLHIAHRLIRRIGVDARGNVLMIFALSIIPLTFAIGMGIDYSRAEKLQTKLNAVADAAALASLTTTMMNQPILNACTIARNSFITQTANLRGLTLNNIDPAQLTITITDSYATIAPVTLICPAAGVSVPAPVVAPLSRTTTVSYRGKSLNSFAGVLGMQTLTIKGSTSAKTTLAPYIDIHLALDTSQSMGLAATNNDAVLLYNATLAANGPTNGCTFGCHAFQSAPIGSPNAITQYPNDALAKSVGAQLRIDVLRSASQSMVQTALSGEGAQQYYRFALYRIGASTSTISPLTTNLSQTLTDINGLTLGPNTSNGTGDTNLPDLTNYVFPNIVAHGDGTNQANARAFLFIVTDGVTDIYRNGQCYYSHCTKPIDPTTCNQYKNANPGVTVGIVYTTYLPVYANPLNPSPSALRPEYTNLVKHFSDPSYSSPNPSDNSLDIAPALQACASPGWFLQASDGPSIQAAMTKLFTQATQTPTITH